MIAFEQAGKAYRNRKGLVSWVMRDLTMLFPDGLSTGILAPRGQGKTTLIELAAGNEAPSEGRVRREGRVSWPYGTRSIMSPRLTGKQNLRFLTDVYGRDFGEAYEFVRVFADLGRFLDMPVRQYNSEMRARLSVSMLFALDFEHILVDDSMDGGDNAFRRRCTRHIEENSDRITFFIATSNPQIVSKYCQTAGVLNEGKLAMYSGVDEAIEHFNQVNQVYV